MSLAPASSRGFFLNARFAVNGIQCAARSFGTLTDLELGLLSSMGGLFDVWGVRLRPRYQLRHQTGTPTRRDISTQSHGHSVFKRSGPGSRKENASKRKT